MYYSERYTKKPKHVTCRVRRDHPRCRSDTCTCAVIPRLARHSYIFQVSSISVQGFLSPPRRGSKFARYHLFIYLLSLLAFTTSWTTVQAVMLLILQCFYSDVVSSSSMLRAWSPAVLCPPTADDYRSRRQRRRWCRQRRFQHPERTRSATRRVLTCDMSGPRPRVGQ